MWAYSVQAFGALKQFDGRKLPKSKIWALKLGLGSRVR